MLIPTFSNSKAADSETSSSWDCQDDSNALNESNMKDVRFLLESLPRNLHFDKYQQQQKQGVAGSDISEPEDLQKLDVLTEENEDDEKTSDEIEAGLKIAWQYRKTVQDERSGNVSVTTSLPKSNRKSKEFCHSYDLQQNLNDQINVLESTTVLDFISQDENISSSRQRGFDFYQTIKAKIDSLLENRKQVIRILLYRVPSISTLSIALPLLVSYVRQKQLPVIILTASQVWTFGQSNIQLLNGLRRTSDVVLQAEGFASRREYPQPGEFRMFQGLLKVRKINTFTAASAVGHFADRTNTRQPAADLYGLKRDRRKLNIQLLHIPPEDFADAGGSVGGGAVRSGAGRPSKSTGGGLSCATSGGELAF